jgi:hypothetical protein
VLRLATFHKIGWFGILSVAERALKQGIMKTPGSSGLYILSFKYDQYLHMQCIVILQDSMPPVLFMDILPGTQPTQYY